LEAIMPKGGLGSHQEIKPFGALAVVVHRQSPVESRHLCPSTNVSGAATFAQPVPGRIDCSRMSPVAPGSFR
jgi:hypothetical protein